MNRIMDSAGVASPHKQRLHFRLACFQLLGLVGVRGHLQTEGVVGLIVDVGLTVVVGVDRLPL